MRLSMLTESLITEGERKFTNTQFDIEIAGYTRTQGSPISEIQKMISKIDKKDLTGDGVEDNHHVTVLFGLHTTDHKDVEKLVKGFGTVYIQYGKTSIFEAEEHDVVKVEISGERLFELNKLLKKLPYTNNYPDYKPHMTLAYVKPGAGKKYVGMDDINGYESMCTRLTFSPPSGGEKTVIDLGKDMSEQKLRSLENNALKIK